MQITLYHTNDIHSHIDEFTRIASYVKHRNQDTSLCLDAGDFHDFLQIGMMGTQGRMGKYLLEEAGYDAVAVGNNEGFAGDAILEILAATGRTQVLTCNITKKNGQELSGIKKSIHIEKQGIRFLILGVSPFAESYQVFYQMENLAGKDAISAIQEELAQQKGTYDVCILLSHLGLQEDRNIVPICPEIDIIIGGHSHDDMEHAEQVGTTWIHHSGAYGKKLGVLQVTIEEGKVVHCKGENLACDDWPMDERCQCIIAKQNQIAKAILNKPFYTLPHVLWYDPVIENPLTNFICDALFKEYPCDLALLNSGIISFGLQGDISKMKLLQCSPSHLNPTHVTMKGYQIREAVRCSLDADHCLQAGKGAGFRGYCIGRLHMSRNVQILIKDKDVDILVNGRSISDNEDIHVVTSDYLQRGSGYPSLASDCQVAYEQGFIRDVVERHITDEQLQHSAYQTRYIYFP